MFYEINAYTLFFCLVLYGLASYAFGLAINNVVGVHFPQICT